MHVSLTNRSVAAAAADTPLAWQEYNGPAASGGRTAHLGGAVLRRYTGHSQQLAGWNGYGTLRRAQRGRQRRAKEGVGHLPSCWGAAAAAAAAAAELRAMLCQGYRDRDRLIWPLDCGGPTHGSAAACCALNAAGTRRWPGAYGVPSRCRTWQTRPERAGAWNAPPPLPPPPPALSSDHSGR